MDQHGRRENFAVFIQSGENDEPFYVTGNTITEAVKNMLDSIKGRGTTPARQIKPNRRRSKCSSVGQGSRPGSRFLMILTFRSVQIMTTQTVIQEKSLFPLAIMAFCVAKTP